MIAANASLIEHRQDDQQGACQEDKVILLGSVPSSDLYLEDHCVVSFPLDEISIGLPISQRRKPKIAIKAFYLFS